METILDAEDCWEIVLGTEVIPIDLTPVATLVVFGAAAIVVVAHTAAELLVIATRVKERKDFIKRVRRAATIITTSIDDGMVQTSEFHNNDPKLMWDALAAAYDTVTPAQLSFGRQ